MPAAAVNGITLYYEDEGRGEPLVFIPGLSGTTDLWTLQTRHFNKSYRTISLDNRGAGRSSKPFGVYSMHQFASDLHALLDHLDVQEPVTLIGASMGGLIAQNFVRNFPGRVRNLVLACTGVSAGDPRVTFPSADVQRRIALPGHTREAKVQTYLDVFYHPEFVASRPELKAFFLSKDVDPQPPYAYLAQLAACADPRPYFRWLTEIAVPTLILHGADDLVWPVKNAHTLKEGLGMTGELTILEKAGHMVMQEQPATFNACLEAFLQKH